MIDGTDSGGDDTFDFRRYLRVLYDQKWTILIFLAVVVGGATVWVLDQTPIYRAAATVQVDLRAPSVLGREVEQVEELGTGSYWNNQEYLRTQYKVIQSREVTSRVVEALRLDNDPHFAGAGEKTRTPTEIAEMLRGRIMVEPVRDSRLIEISVEDTDPERARTIVNAVADAYLAQNVDRMLESTKEAQGWLANQLDDLQEGLETSERALYDFRRERDILSVSLEDRQNITANQIQKLSDALTAARASRIELSAKVDEMRALSKQDPLDIPVDQLLENTLIQQLKRRHAELEEERAGLTKVYGKNWPRVREIDGELERIRQRIGREVASVLESVESEHRAALRTEQGLKAALSDVQEEALKLNLHELDYNRLVRRANSNSKMYELVLERTKETDLARYLNVNNLRVLDYAIVPRRPVKPRVHFVLMIAAFIGLLGGIALALVIDALDVSVKGQQDLERMGLVFLGLVPSINDAVARHKRKKRKRKKGEETGPDEDLDLDDPIKLDLVVHQMPQSTVAEACRSIRTNLLFMSPERELNTLLVTSPGPQEGKTTVAISLAIVMAQGGARVALVDLDLRRPRAHQPFFGKEKEPGISQAIVGNKSLDEVVRPTDIEGLSVVSSGPIPPKPAELLHTMRFRQLLEELATRFDRVVIDSPPLGPVTDAAILSTQVDGVVLVAKSRVTRREAVRGAWRQLSEIGARVLGTVVNNVSSSHRSYGYYNYYYYRKRGYNYYSSHEGGSSRRSLHSSSSKESTAPPPQ